MDTLYPTETVSLPLLPFSFSYPRSASMSDFEDEKEQQLILAHFVIAVCRFNSMVCLKDHDLAEMDFSKADKLADPFLSFPPQFFYKHPLLANFDYYWVR